MPYAVIEKMYSSLSLERQKEVYDFISFLMFFEKQKEAVNDSRNSYHKGFFDLFGCCDDDSFVEPEDMVAVDCEDELF